MEENQKQVSKSLDDSFHSFSVRYCKNIRGFKNENTTHRNITSIAASFQFINDYFETHFGELIRVCPPDFRPAIEAILNAHISFNLDVGKYYGMASTFFKMNMKIMAAIGQTSTSDDDVKILVTELKKSVDRFPDMQPAIDKYKSALELLNQKLANCAGLDNFQSIVDEVEKQKIVVITYRKIWEDVDQRKIILEEDLKMLPALQNNSDQQRKYLSERYTTLTEEKAVWKAHLERSCKEHTGITNHYISIFGMDINIGRSGKTTDAYQKYCKDKIETIDKLIDENFQKMNELGVNFANLSGKLKSQFETAIKEEEIALLRLETEVSNYDSILTKYKSLYSSIGGLSEQNREKLSYLMDCILKGMGYLSFSLGQVAGSLITFKTSFDPTSPSKFLRLVEFLAPILECSAVAKVRQTQDLAFLQTGEFVEQLGTLNDILEKRNENDDATVQALANNAFDRVGALEGEVELEPVVINTPAVTRKPRVRR